MSLISPSLERQELSVLREQPRQQFRLFHKCEPDVMSRAGILGVLYVAAGLSYRSDNDFKQCWKRDMCVALGIPIKINKARFSAR
jgi:hypothetical protein